MKLKSCEIICRDHPVRRGKYSIDPIPFLRGEEDCGMGEFPMRADIFIDRTEGGTVGISVVRDGLSSGAGQKYATVEEARSVLVKFGLHPEQIDRQLQSLSKAPTNFLLRFPAAEIADDVLRSLHFWAAAFRAA